MTQLQSFQKQVSQPLINTPGISQENRSQNIINHEIHLLSRPRGMPIADNFSIVQSTIRPIVDQEILVRNLYMSVDPYMRGRMNDEPSYVPPFELDQPMNGGAIGEVLQSNSKNFKCGDIVTSNLGWREYAIATPRELHWVNPDIIPLSAYLGVLGMTGMTAWAGLNLVNVKSGDIVFISGAAGAVGSIAGQFAKRRGCHVIGATGSLEKVNFLQDECGFDTAFNYKSGSILEQLNQAAPDGIDVYFDNVGGVMLETALSALRLNGRIVACGSISNYNNETLQPGPSNLFNVIRQRLTMKGLIVGDHLDRRPEFEEEVGHYFQTGKLKNKETIVVGLDQAVNAFLGLFEGENIGKMVVKLA
jgi:NADPH-dependent curcumin reductase CurA